MAATRADAFGRIELEYIAYGLPHIMRYWVREFGTDPGVGTFSGSTTPANLDALATLITSYVKPLYESGSSLAWGAWRGIKTTVPSTGAGIVIVEGTVTPGSASFWDAANAPAGLTQGTWSFRDADGHLVRYSWLGPVYGGPAKFVYSTLPARFKNFADFVTGSAVIVSRGNLGVTSMIDITYDTNDGLTRHTRR